MVNAVFLFPGQGAQYPGMALDLLRASGPSGPVAELFAAASEATKTDMEKLLAEADPETLKRTDISQPAITLANLAAAAVLTERGYGPVACAGFSLGEYAALTVAGTLTREACFSLVTARGAAMQRTADRLAAQEGAPGMAAVLGLPPDAVEALVARWRDEGIDGLYAANFNSPNQVVVAGTSAALADAEGRFKEAGAKRVIRLKVAGPFHSPLVADAAEAFASVLEAAPFADPALPLFSNVTGSRVASGAEARALALRQITEPVRWTAEQAAIVECVAGTGTGLALEVGPGKVLQGLWKDSPAGFPCVSAGTAADIDALGAGKA